MITIIAAVALLGWAVTALPEFIARAMAAAGGDAKIAGDKLAAEVAASKAQNTLTRIAAPMKSRLAATTADCGLDGRCCCGG